MGGNLEKFMGFREAGPNPERVMDPEMVNDVCLLKGKNPVEIEMILWLGMCVQIIEIK